MYWRTSIEEEKGFFIEGTSKVFKTLEIFSKFFFKKHTIIDPNCHKVSESLLLKTMNKNIIFMKPERFYHIYNRACGFEKLFLSDSNFKFFMEIFDENLKNYVTLYAYCLMPNHFHFLVKTKNIYKIDDPGRIYSKQFGNYFNSYAKSFNKFNRRKGSLFSQNFKKKEIDSMEYLRSVLIYIHQNPVRHGYTDKIDAWRYSSYKEIISGKSVYCHGNSELLDLFRNLDILKFCHKIKVNIDLD